MPVYQDTIKFCEVLVKYHEKLINLHYSFEFKVNETNIRISAREDYIHVYFGALPMPAMTIWKNTENLIKNLKDENYIMNLDWISFCKNSKIIEEYELTGTQYLDEPDAFDFSMDIQYDKFHSECYKLHAAICRSPDVGCIEMNIKHFFYHKICLNEVMEVMNKIPFFWKGVL